MIIPVILAGGSGTRLWPLSRKLHPKQVLALLGDRTLVQETVLRLRGLDAAAPVVICNDEHRFIVAEQLRDLDERPAALILEPVARNTAPAVAVAALYALAQSPDATLLMLPADHLITDSSAFHTAVVQAVDYARDGHLVTFGIVPAAPETGYGYIMQGAAMPHGPGRKIQRFVEKPDTATAEGYVRSGQYFWNSGMFVLRADAVLAELTRFAPEIVRGCRESLEKAVSDLDFLRLDHDAFAGCPEDSIDYAVMERTDRGVMVPLSCGWSDLGSWDALWQAGEKDGDGNVTRGDVLLCDVRDSFLHAETRLLAAVGLENHIVVETSDAVLVSPRDRVQEVKKLVDRLKAQNRVEAVSHKKVFRPWGHYESIGQGERYQVKRITVTPGHVLSLQKHFHRAEHWVVVRGTAVVTRDGEEILVRENESVYLPLGAVHRLANPGRIPLELIEVQVGGYLGEDDIIRFEDVYGR
ncbi:mannose-1-phosphate guanylyltransferase/mannose-6-phosphate isomerase [Desulfomicrobium orale]|uniref:mannose-1-phosphate guanylyltransferase n=1 Tax=Desulfomicrobium orale DSM 12838 TaxID=888061 RepID=A0A0X8JR82_9BACT|nr:mannose-1-phosphate guanylyltransferase/mannose-6-phosphate isomerase [Desulfomicrobium orale]AMD93267.1 mannose-1-phosphate guanyltransferase [Desulfomicrobium orale DSM 12838]